MFNKYYQEELAFLRDLGEEFAAAHPEVAHMLSGAGSDPDVERLLEGFAFLTGRIRQKLDDELPELTHTLIRLLWPHYLRPIPALSIVEFTPRPGVLRGGEVVRRGAEIDSIPVEGTPCRFQTTRDVEVWPIELREARIDERAGAAPRLTLRIGPVEGASLGALGVDRLRLFLHGEPAEVYPLYDLLTRRATALGVEARLGGQTVARRDLDATAIQAAGFAGDEPLFPYPANCFPGYRLLQEYFALPAKFLAVELSGLATAAPEAAACCAPMARPRSPRPGPDRASTSTGGLPWCRPDPSCSRGTRRPTRSSPSRSSHRRLWPRPRRTHRGCSGSSWR